MILKKSWSSFDQDLDRMELKGFAGARSPRNKDLLKYGMKGEKGENLMVGIGWYWAIVWNARRKHRRLFM
jgi:hypothetical protein